MRTPCLLLKFAAKAALNAIGAGLAGELIVEVMPGVAQDVWDWWGESCSPAERQAEVEQLAKASASEVREAVAAVMQEVASEADPSVREALEAYLDQLSPETKRPSDTSDSACCFLAARQPQRNCYRNPDSDKALRPAWNASSGFGRASRFGFGQYITPQWPRRWKFPLATARLARHGSFSPPKMANSCKFGLPPRQPPTLEIHRRSLVCWRIQAACF